MGHDRQMALKDKRMTRPTRISDISIPQFCGTDTLSLTDLKTVNLFVGKNVCGKTSIPEAIDEQMMEVTGNWYKSMWNKYRGTDELNLKKLESRPKEEFPSILVIKDIEMGMHYTEFCPLWIELIDFAILHSIQLFVTTHSYECIEALVDVCKNRYPDKNLIRLFRIEKKKGYKIYALTQEQLVAAIDSKLEIR